MEQHKPDSPEDSQPVTTHFFIPKRYILVVMCCLAVCLSISSRNSLGKTLLLVSYKEEENITAEYSNECKGDEPPRDEPTNKKTAMYHWNEDTLFVIESLFYFGYAATHIPGGALADLRGGKYVLASAVLGISLITFITPLVIKNCNGNTIILILTRVAAGIFEGVVFPSICSMFGQWIPASERTTAVSLMFSNAELGILASDFTINSLLAKGDDWSVAFYIIGSCGIVWCVIWHFVCYSNPDSHPSINETEKKFLHEKIDFWNERYGKKKIPWKQFFISKPTWGMYCTQIGLNWAWALVFTELPSYMKRFLKFESEMWNNIYLIVMFASSVACGILSDYLINKDFLERTTARKIFSTFGSMGTGIFSVAAAYTGCNRVIAPAMLTVAMFFVGPYNNLMEVNILDLAPNFAGTMMGFANTVGICMSAFIPYVVGAIKVNNTLLQWKSVFWVTLIVFAVTDIIFAVVGTGEVQPWNNNAVQN